MNPALLLTGGAIVLVALVMIALRLRPRRRRPSLAGGPPGGDDRIASPPIPTAGAGAAVADFYAPSFIVDPGHCFRLCRDPATGTGLPCNGRVEGRGVFVDHRGNQVEVEACGMHMIDLDNWRFDPVDG